MGFCPIQQPGSYCDWSSALPSVGVQPTEVGILIVINELTVDSNFYHE